jgi:hypothetical protein
MTTQLSKWSFLVLLPALALNCDATESDLADAQESDTGEFDEFRDFNSLGGSNFEIDANANLKQDDPDPSIDWTSQVVNDVVQSDTATGKNDSSYVGGTKEDDACATIGTGSIPNNKSDIKQFSVWQELGVPPGDPGYLHLFWTRVQDPTGTTLMDFELNQSNTACSLNNPTKQRTVGDLLLEYRLAQGGTVATITLREWNGNAWGTAVDLSQSGKALGTINTTAILEADTGGLGSLSARTFGEATIDLDVIFKPGQCQSFGNAFVKSRSSDTFSSALKDVTPVLGINISNCGGVTIRKDIQPDDPNLKFDFTHTMANNGTFKLGDNGAQSFPEVVFGTYTVREKIELNPDYKLTEIDCSASVGVTVPVNNIDLNAGTVTFTIDADTDRVDCKFINHKRGGAIKIVKTRDHAALGVGPHAHQGVTFKVRRNGYPDQTGMTDSNGVVCIGGLDLGPYTVTELLPAEYKAAGLVTRDVNVVEGSCPNPDPTNVLQFHNIPLTNITMSVDSRVDGGTKSTISCVGQEKLVSATAPDNGDGSLTILGLEPGTYSCEVEIESQ